MSAYASYPEFQAVSFQPKDTDAAKFRILLERASRTFDLLCGVEPDYFQSTTYDLWQSNRVYEVGDIVVPTTSNVHKYRVTTAGTSGSTEPTWPTGLASTVTDGDTVFTENGTDVIATTEQVVYGEGIAYLKIPPYIEGSIAVDGVEMPSGYTVPSYAEKDGYLVVTDSNGIALVPGIYPDDLGFPFYLGGWPQGVPVTITAQWGYDGVPEDIKQVVIELAIKFWRQNDPAYARTADLPAVSIEPSPLSQKIIDKYRMKKAVAFA